jgi:glycosyltransferase involved in cell wall biosynthesis
MAIGAIVKNEAPYLLEWIAFHRCLGIRRFFVADNGSTDGTTALLAGLDRAGVLRHIPFPGRPGEAPQLPAYAAIVAAHGREADWIAFLDADEFLLPGAPHRRLPPIFAALPAEAGAVAVNWAVYGSSGHRSAGPGNVIERFTRRATREAPVNRHYKTVLRPAAFGGTAETPHAFRLVPGFRTLRADGWPLEPGTTEEGQTGAVLWEPLRINHYVVKSWEEFAYRKRARGRATRAEPPRDRGFFRCHDSNEVADPVPGWLVAATRREQQRLAACLRAAGPRGVPAPAAAVLAPS